MGPALHLVDWFLIIAYGAFALGVGFFFRQRASAGVSSFFVGDRRLSWWMAGTSMVATTFAADTPLAVTGIVATQGISGNWLWWSWAIAHLSATFLFARMWRRSGVITDAEITEIRYSGPAATWLRGFKALYFGIFINCLTMAWVIAAMVKISRAFFDVPAGLVIVVCVALAVLYTVLGGFHSVVATDVVQFSLGMGGAVVLAIIVVHHFGGMGSPPASGSDNGTGLVGALAASTAESGHSLDAILDFVPAADHPTMPLVAFLVLLGVGWWRYAEGNGYVVQRLAACRDEAHAQSASLWFSIAHNALRPWPWIVVGLAALVIYPLPSSPAHERLVSQGPGPTITIQPGRLDVATGGTLTLTGVPEGARLRILDQVAEVTLDASGAYVAHFGPLSASANTEAIILSASGETIRALSGMQVTLIDREMAYPLLLGRFLPPGLLGLVIASLLAAFMSTVDTHTNWGASYLVQDIYKRFIAPEAGPARCVMVSRVCVVLIAALAGLTALFIENIAEVWRFLVTLGAGLGSVTALRWYWSRVTPHAEIAALGVTTLLALTLQLFFTETLFGGPNPLFLVKIEAWRQILIIAFASLSTWVAVALLGPKNDPRTLRGFAARIQPAGPGWRGYREGPQPPIAAALARVAAGAVVVYGSLFGIGHLILGRVAYAAIWLCAAALLLAWLVWRARKTSPAT
jgi:Na+/proline symporter